MNAATDITRLLGAWKAGDPDALAEITPHLYDELRRIAGRYMRRESAGHTLQPTALVHEAYARVVDVDLSWQSRAQFLGFMAHVMRQVLVDHARARQSEKRGGDAERVTLDTAAFEGIVPASATDADDTIVALHEALEQLKQFDELKSRIVELRYFGGLTNDEAAAVLGLSLTTYERELRLAKAWLRHTLGG